MTEIRIERKRRPWWLLILILLIAVAVGAWLYYSESQRGSRRVITTPATNTGAVIAEAPRAA